MSSGLVLSATPGQSVVDHSQPISLQGTNNVTLECFLVEASPPGHGTVQFVVEESNDLENWSAPGIAWTWTGYVGNTLRDQAPDLHKFTAYSPLKSMFLRLRYELLNSDATGTDPTTVQLAAAIVAVRNS